MTDNEFWSIVQSEAFQNRFYGEHPLIKDNGGQAFYNVDNLKAIRQRYREAQLQQITARNRWVYRNGINVVTSWIRQVEWIDKFDS